jgi:hypothetical protein
VKKWHRDRAKDFLARIKERIKERSPGIGTQDETPGQEKLLQGQDKRPWQETV